MKWVINEDKLEEQAKISRDVIKVKGIKCRRGTLMDNGEILKVAAKSNPNSVAGALAGVVREKGKAEMQAIGAGAVN